MHPNGSHNNIMGASIEHGSSPVLSLLILKRRERERERARVETAPWIWSIGTGKESNKIVKKPCTRAGPYDIDTS
eukprot:2257124-Amphidinium_carterae.1